MSASPLPDGLLIGPLSQGPGGGNYCLEIRTAVAAWSVQRAIRCPSVWCLVLTTFPLPLGLSFLVNKKERDKKLLWSNAV